MGQKILLLHAVITADFSYLNGPQELAFSNYYAQKHFKGPSTKISILTKSEYGWKKASLGLARMSINALGAGLGPYSVELG